jgi:hypothetical protein
MDGAFFSATLLDSQGGLQSGSIQPLDREAAKSLSTHWGTWNWWDDVVSPLSSIDQEPDFHWNWTGVISTEILNRRGRRSVCVRTPDGKIQGAMIYWIGARSVLCPGQLVVYIDRLATAPANREKLVTQARFQGVGRSLVRYAMIESFNNRCDGRLTAYPIANESFYGEQGFQKTDEFHQGEQTFLFEVTAETAQQTLRTLGVIQ